MSQLTELLDADYSNNTNPDYQANLYLIESAMRELGHTEQPTYQPSAYDDALTKLIDAVPME